MAGRPDLTDDAICLQVYLERLRPTRIGTSMGSSGARLSWSPKP
jgi:hypothetical protein